MTTPTKKRSAPSADSSQVGQKKETSYMPTHASVITGRERQERLAIIERIPANACAALTHLTTTNYQVDRSIREATLASPNDWQEEMDVLVFTSSDTLKVYLGTPRAPL